jgi:DNA-binding transcriptional LysR family regulator
MTRRVVVTVPRFSTLPFLLRRSKLVVAMPSVAASHYARLFDLNRFALPVKSPVFDLSMVWHARFDSDLAHEWFRALVREEVANVRAEAIEGTPLRPSTRRRASKDRSGSTR